MTRKFSYSLLSIGLTIFSGIITRGGSHLRLFENLSRTSSNDFSLLRKWKQYKAFGATISGLNPPRYTTGDFHYP